MTTKKLLNLQLRRLLASVVEHGNQHLGQVEADLLQTSSLLAEAIEKLNTSFMAIHASIRIQQEAVNAVLAGKTDGDGYTARLVKASTEMDTHVNAAVTGLQFQDMTSQLIGRALQRVSGLSGVLGTLDARGSGVMEKTGIEEIVALLSDVRYLLEQKSGKLESDLWNPVCQTHMESGDIELF